MERRDFLKATAAAGPLLWLSSCGGGAERSTGGTGAGDTGEAPDAALRELAEFALNAARDAGASYADARIVDVRTQRISSREARVTGISDTQSFGAGVRVVVDGAWGFAASARVDRDELARIATRAVAIAKANAKLVREPVQLAPVDAHVGVWRTPVRRDPFEIGLDQKADLLLEINAEALRIDGVSFCSSSMAFVREHKLFASTEGSVIEQTLHRCNPTFSVTAVDRDAGEFASRNSYASPQGMGWEYVEDYPWFEDVRQAAEDCREKLSAPSVEPGVRDLILHPSNLWLTIHESVGHPTELDRAMGLEANYAGTSFLTLDERGSFRFGSDLVNLRGERTQPLGLATCGYDDEGVPTTEWPIVENGVFVDYQTTREQAHLLGRSASHATAHSQSWRDVTFQRMPNVDLLPGEEPLTLDELVADTEDAILVHGRGSYSIDHQRYNFQFGGQTFWKVENGEVRGQLKDVAYQARTPEFWASCDAICDAREYEVNGTFNDGKGEPGQSNAVSHGCAPARFRGIHILNTARDA